MATDHDRREVIDALCAPADRLRKEARAALDALSDGPDVGRMLAQAHERGSKEACALVRQLMGEHGVEQHDPESLDYDHSRLPALVTALWRLTEPRVEPPPDDSPAAANRADHEVLSEASAYKREMAGPNGGSSEGVAYVVSRKVCSCQPLMAGGDVVVPATTNPAACPIHGTLNVMTVPELLRFVRQHAAQYPGLAGLDVEMIPSERMAGGAMTGEAIGFRVPHGRVDRRHRTGHPVGDLLAVAISSRDPDELRHAVDVCARGPRNGSVGPG